MHHGAGDITSPGRFSARSGRPAHLGGRATGREASRMISHLHRSLLIAGAVAVLAPAAASATTFCVGVPGCAGTPESTLQAALTAAGGATASANRIELGSGTWVGANSAGAQPQGLEIVGAGPGLTFLRSSAAGQPA